MPCMDSLRITQAHNPKEFSQKSFCETFRPRSRSRPPDQETRWRFQWFLMFTPDPWGKTIQFAIYFFQMGWFKHQLAWNSQNPMKNGQGLAHLTTRWFTIKTSKHVGFGMFSGTHGGNQKSYGTRLRPRTSWYAVSWLQAILSCRICRRKKTCPFQGLGF